VTNEGLSLPCPLTAGGLAYGRAFHRGDVVFLRLTDELPQQAWERVLDGFRDLLERTGVEVVVLGPSVQLVEQAP